MVYPVRCIKHFFYFFVIGRKDQNLVEETNDLSGNVLATSLLVVHDTGRGGEDDVSELTGWEQTDNPLLELAELNVVAGRDDTSLVEAAKLLVAYSTKSTRVCVWVHTGR